MEELGELTPVPPRKVWMDEARDFTPWLMANPDVLGKALGIELEFGRAEQPIGSFALDLIGRDLTNDAVLMVENQLEHSDHTHLGQVITYAAGSGAATIVWIATEFRPEHRQAIDWLNEHTLEDVRFFAVQLGLVRIGESPVAPVLDVVAQPNDWQRHLRAVSRAARISGKGELYYAFWRRYVEKLRREHPDWVRGEPSFRSHLATHSPVKGTILTANFGERGRIMHQMWIDSGDAGRNKAIFDRLAERRTEFERAYGRSLEWDWREDRKACKIVDAREGSIGSEGEYEEYIEWFVDAGERFRRALEAVGLSGDLVP